MRILKPVRRVECDDDRADFRVRRESREFCLKRRADDGGLCVGEREQKDVAMSMIKAFWT